MSSTIFFERLQSIKDKNYPENAISQFEEIALSNNGKLPNIFHVTNIGRNTICKILTDLSFKEFEDFNVYAPNGPNSPIRQIILF